jgi:hypothetical protein
MESLSVQLGDPMKYMYHAGRECGDCGEDLMLAEDVVIVQISVPQMHEGTVIHPAFENPDGSYAGLKMSTASTYCWRNSAAQRSPTTTPTGSARGARAASSLGSLWGTLNTDS